MSDAPDRDQKQFEPSSQRLAKAREDGNVFHSRDFVSAGLLLVGASVLLMGAPFAFARMQALLRRCFAEAARPELSVDSVAGLSLGLVLEVGVIVLPFLGAVMAASAGLHALQTGVHVSLKPIMPKGSRINPMAGVKRLFSAKNLFELLKSIAKIAIVGPMAYGFIRGHLPEIMMLHTAPLEVTLATAGGWIHDLLMKVLMALTVLAGIDFAYGKWNYKRDLKMTFEEVKQETKDSDGDPQTRSRRKAFARKLLSRPRIDHAVMAADVVITNPTHYAVALRYNPAESGAPRVLVKGIRKRALRIKALAAEHHIPTVENRPLARALYNGVAEQQEIPEELYAAVAAVLAEIYRRRKQPS